MASKKKESSRTLCSLLKYMEGIEVIVELKTGRRYRGTMSSADDYMNITLDDAEEEMKARRNGSKSDSSNTSPPLEILPILNIRGPKIRYIHFPDNADMSNIVRTGVERERAAANKYNRGKRK